MTRKAKSEQLSSQKTEPNQTCKHRRTIDRVCTAGKTEAGDRDRTNSQHRDAAATRRVKNTFCKLMPLAGCTNRKTPGGKRRVCPIVLDNDVSTWPNFWLWGQRTRGLRGSVSASEDVLTRMRRQQQTHKKHRRTPPSRITITPVVSGFSSHGDLQPSDDRTRTMFVVEQAGTMRIDQGRKSVWQQRS